MGIAPTGKQVTIWGSTSSAMLAERGWKNWKHDFSDYQTKQSLMYDLEEPFRWLIDVSVLRAFESGALELSDFYFTGDDYRYRFEFDAKQRFII